MLLVVLEEDLVRRASICGSVVKTIDRSAWPLVSTSWRRSMATGVNFLKSSP